MRILLAEDNKELAASITTGFEKLGFSLEVYGDGCSADRVLADTDFDAAILDVGLPRMSGFDVLARLRSRDKMLPVLMLTARGEVADRVRGLNLGADDYLAKPFAFDELEARVKALMRRTHSSGSIQCAGLVYDLEAKRFKLNGAALELTPREHSLLTALIARPGRLLSKEQMASRIFGLGEEARLEAIEIYVHRVRKKLERSGVGIVTMRGLGYLLESSGEVTSN